MTAGFPSVTAYKVKIGAVSCKSPAVMEGPDDLLATSTQIVKQQTDMDIIAMDDTIVDDIDTKNKLKKLVIYLKEMPENRDKEILIKRYGLNGKEPMTQKEVAKELGISRSYVSRIEKRILNELKNSCLIWFSG